MAMTVRFSTDLDTRVEQLAQEQHTSKHALVVRAVEELLMRETKTRKVLDSLDETGRDYAGLIRRLEDA